jgi:phosphomannomutase
VRTRVGHSFIKQVMAETGAAFGGEHSGHYYFRDNYRADSGIIAAVTVLEVISKAGQPLSVLRKPFERYVASGEINTRVDDPHAVIEFVAGHFAHARQDRLDGLTVDLTGAAESAEPARAAESGEPARAAKSGKSDWWWFNLRPSNTEPLLRLNLEARTQECCDEHVAEVRDLIARGQEAR